MVIKLMSRKLLRSNSKINNNNNHHHHNHFPSTMIVKWELRPGGLLVQRRDLIGEDGEEAAIRVRISMGQATWHEVSIDPTSTFGELKKMVALVTRLERREQRVLFKGKERDDDEHLHMVGVRDMDKVLVMEDPATRERKLNELLHGRALEGTCYTAIKV